MNNQLAEQTPQYGDITRVLVQGDLSKLSEKQRVEYFDAVCDSLGLNKLTQPFEFVNLKGKLKLYATKNCTDQLRRLRGVSIQITATEVLGEVLCVRVRATDKDGRFDEDEGITTIGNLKGDDLANARMKAITKAKRRVTLSLCGLGMLDESELETIPGAAVVVRPEPRPAPQPEAPKAIADQAPTTPQPAPQPAPAKGTLPQVTQRILLDAFHQLDLAWNDSKCKTRASEILGRTVGENDHISTLSIDEADKLIKILVAKIDEKKAKSAARAAKKETAGATA